MAAILNLSHHGCQKSDKVFVYACIVIAVFCNFFYQISHFVLAYIRSNMSTSDINAEKRPESDSGKQMLACTASDA